jgi:hypothetical protein
MLVGRLAEYVAYFESLALQPANRWDGFYLTEQETGNFGLRYQIALSCLALGVLSLHPDAEPPEQERCFAAMEGLIERMMQRRVWAYWAMEAERRGLNPDPLAQGNVQYGGLLAMMMGVLEVVSPNRRFDETFTLLWTGSEQFPYNYHTLAYGIAQQMEQARHFGVESFPGRVHVGDMSAAVWGLLLHDAVHGSEYQSLVDGWLSFLRGNLVCGLLGSISGGVFRAWYLPRLGMGVPFSLGVIDGWTLALLAVLEPAWVEGLFKRFERRIRRVQGSSLAFVPSASLLRSREISDVGMTTGTAYLLAVHLGQAQLANDLLRYADASFQPVEDQGRRYYNGGAAAPIVTALVALGEAGGMQTLFDVMHGAEPPRNPPAEVQEADAGDTGDAGDEPPQEGEPGHTDSRQMEL